MSLTSKDTMRSWVVGYLRDPANRPIFEFHVRADVRRRYEFDDTFFSSSGNVVFADFAAVQNFTHRFNRDRPDHQKVTPATLNAASLMDEVLHYAIAHYRENVDAHVMERTLAELDDEYGRESVDKMLVDFIALLPNTEVYRNRTDPRDYLSGETGGISNRVLTLEELLVNRLTNENPAFEPVYPLIGDAELKTDSNYPAVVEAFARPTAHGTRKSGAAESLADFLREPQKRAPYSLTAQIEFVRERWGIRIAPFMAERLEMARGLLAEERYAMERRGFGGGPGPVAPPSFEAEPEEENFSRDVDWMPRVIMIAKNALVWLDQLSKKYDRTIERLDQIPDEEIIQLARWGFNALWLIGVWERSEASRKLKQWTGNPDAAPSAYSLDDYVIADRLGGDDALAEFKARCHRWGVRLASDMVPNHTGIDSKWVREHPDWFIQLPHPPYPSYRYTSESLGGPDGPILQVEDGYFDRSDAAVAFRYVDRTTGEERFIYHGNDGTGMPWNDTAQLDFTRQDVREAVIQTILHVARLFPIIRFDAAMVLTKKHFHRLWYPEPGSGEGVPSRAAYGLRRAAFDKRMPSEFWREVVDRVARELPDTLLLAEAFWLLEGYFVRTLGMHRVYNSAFMHMLKKEDNAEYRQVIKKTVAFEPEILKRYVNFMSNPDEETAIEQFGDGDKYFGVCTLMLTLPGLPMFGHGQVEGFREKYGMEYQRAYLDEEPDSELVTRHLREIVPVAAKRYLFAEVDNFHLFDFGSDVAGLNENVFAFTNRAGKERVLVLYNNRFEQTEGSVLQESLDAEDPRPPINLLEALDLNPKRGDVVTARDLVTGLNYLMPADQLMTGGLQITLRGFERRVLTSFEIVPREEADDYLELARQLGGLGVKDLHEAKSDLMLRPFVNLLAHVVHEALHGKPSPAEAEMNPRSGEPIGLSMEELVEISDEVHSSASLISTLPQLGETHPWKRSSRYRSALKVISRSMSPDSAVRPILVAERLLGSLSDLDNAKALRAVEGVVKTLGLAGDDTVKALVITAAALKGLDIASASERRPLERFISLAQSETAQEALGVHEFAGTTYFNKERFETLAAAALCQGAIVEIARAGDDTARCVAKHFDAYRRLLRLMHDTDYDWTVLQGRLKRIRRQKEAVK